MSETAEYMDQLLTWRRHMHQWPEASFEEHKTVAYIRDELSRRVPAAKLEHLTETGLVAVLDTGRPGPKIGIRADIDGLAMTEDRPDLDFASKVPGRMHGCGHDAHAATMMSALAWASDHLDQLSGTIVGIFQHAEETPPGGAKEMVATGYFDDFDYCFGFHYWATLATGTVDVKDGPASANSDLWEIHLHGQGAHASTPEASNDAVLAATTLVQQLLQIPARRVNGLQPAVVTTTWLDAGTHQALNVIPPKASIGGVVRTHDDAVREDVIAAFKHICAGVEAANPGMRCELDYLVGYDMTWNAPGPTQVVRGLAQERWGDAVIADPAMLGGEDFAAFSRTVASTYVFIGAGNAEKGFDSSHHSPTFGLDEDAFPIGLQLTIDVLRNAERLATA